MSAFLHQPQLFELDYGTLLWSKLQPISVFSDTTPFPWSRGSNSIAKQLLGNLKAISAIKHVNKTLVQTWNIDHFLLISRFWGSLNLGQNSSLITLAPKRFAHPDLRKNLIFLVLNLDMHFSRLLRKDKKRFHDSLSFI